MKMNYSLLIMTVFCLTTTAAYADWDKQCLDDCFSTGHECNYCDYQCHVDYNPRTQVIYSNPIPCPFQFRDNDNN